MQKEKLWANAIAVRTYLFENTGALPKMGLNGYFGEWDGV